MSLKFVLLENLLYLCSRKDGLISYWILPGISKIGFLCCQSESMCKIDSDFSIYDSIGSSPAVLSFSR